MARSAEWTSTGAGTSGCNGDWTAAGVYAGYVYWTLGSYYMFYDQYWNVAYVISTVLGTDEFTPPGAELKYHCADIDPSHSWVVDSGGSPAPTVDVCTTGDNYVSTGAGSTDYNRTWVPTGVSLGRAYWQADGSTETISWNDGVGYFFMSDALGTYGVDDYYYNSDGVDPPLSPLTSDGAWSIGTNGAASAPTVSSEGAGATGWESPGTVSGQTGWDNPTNIEAQDDTYAHYEIVSVNTGYLTCTNFGFSIPEGANILGVGVGVDNYFTTGSATVLRLYAQLLINSSPVGSVLSVGGGLGDTVPSSDTDTYQLLGGATDLWGLSAILRSQATASTFGVRIYYIASGTMTGDVYADHLRMKVYHDDMTGGEGGSSTGAMVMSGTAVGTASVLSSSEGAMVMAGTADGVRGAAGQSIGQMVMSGTASADKYIAASNNPSQWAII